MAHGVDDRHFARHELELGWAWPCLRHTVTLATATARDYFDLFASDGTAVLILSVRSVRAVCQQPGAAVEPGGDRLIGDK
jgi:hypothetical protein